MNKLKKGVATSALHDTATRQNDDTSECHPNTRRDLLAQLIDKPAFVKSLIHWFYGPAGAGKTSIMRSLAKALERSNHHLASFYFWRSDGTRNSLRAFVATLAFQIAQQVKPIVPYMEQVLADDDLLLDKSNPTQLEKLVIEPLLALQASNPTAQYPRFIVIDGLDECVEEGQLEFLQTLLPALLTRLSALRLTVYIASRPETLIESEFNAPLLRDVSNRIFLEPSPEDVREFLTAEFEKVNQRYPKLKEKYRGKWPGDEDLEVLCEKSSGYFILSKTAMRHINPPVLRGRAPDRRLSDILEAFMAEPYRPLDALYLHLLRQHAPQDLTDLAEWKKLIGFVCISLYEDLGFWGICLGSLSNARFQIFGKSRSDLAEAFGSLQSLIYIDSRSGRPKNYHASFPDFVFNPERSGDFYVDPGLLHEQLACILIRNFNRIGDPGDIVGGNRKSISTPAFLFHANLARFSDDIEKAAEELNWDKICRTLSDDGGVIRGIFDLVAVVDALVTIFSLSDFPRRDHHYTTLGLNFERAFSKCMDNVSSSDVHSLLVREGIVVRGHPRRYYSILASKCLRHGVESGVYGPPACPPTACHDRTRFFTRVPAGHTTTSEPNSDFFIRFKPPVRVTGLLLAFLDSSSFPLVCARYLSKQVIQTSTLIELIRAVYMVDDTPDWSPGVRELIQYLPHSGPYPQLLNTIWFVCNEKELNNPARGTFVVQWKPSLMVPLPQMDVPTVVRYHIFRYFNQCRAAGMQPKLLSDAYERALWEEASSLVSATEMDYPPAAVTSGPLQGVSEDAALATETLIASSSRIDSESFSQRDGVPTTSLSTTSTTVASDSDVKGTEEKGKKKKSGLLKKLFIDDGSGHIISCPPKKP